MTEENENKFNSAKICWVCEQPFAFRNADFSVIDKESLKNNKPKVIELWVGDKKVRDPCQSTEKDQGTAHVACNLKTGKSFSSFLPTALNNLSNLMHICF